MKKQKTDVYRLFSTAALIISIPLCALVLWHLLTIDVNDKHAIYSVTGFQGHKNLLSSFLFLLTGAVLCGIRYGKFRKLLSFVVIGLLLILMLLLRTKAVLLGVFFTVIIMALTYQLLKSKKTWDSPWITTSILFILSMVFWFVVYPFFLDVLQDNDGGTVSIFSDSERLQLFTKSYDMFKRHPLTGVGAGNWQVYFPAMGLNGIWRAEDLNFTFQRPHNDFLWILNEYGLVGFCLFLLFISAVISGALGSLREKKNGERFSLIVAISIVTGYLFISVFDFPKERIEHVMFFNFFLALCHAPGSNSENAASRQFKNPRLVYFSGLVLFLSIAFCGLMRMKGEYYTKRLLADQKKGDLDGVLRNAGLARSSFYSLDPTSQPIAWYAGNVNAAKGNLTGALAEFNEAYKQHPFNRNVLNDLGSALFNIGEPEQAKLRYIEATIISPRYDEPKLNIVAILISEKKFTEAKKWLTRILHDSEKRTRYTTIVDAMLNQTH